jgi:hypothetical protein
MDDGWKLCEKRKKVMLDEKMGKIAQGERKRKERNRKEKCSFMFLIFYVAGA